MKAGDTSSMYKINCTFYIAIMSISKPKLKIIQFTITPKVMKGINFKKHVQDLYTETYKVMMKVFKLYLKEWKDILCS